MQGDDALQHVNRVIGLFQRFELFGDAEAGLDFAQHRRVGALFPCRGQERLPCRQARRNVVLIDVLNFGDLCNEEGVGGVAVVQ